MARRRIRRAIAGAATALAMAAVVACSAEDGPPEGDAQPSGDSTSRTELTTGEPMGLSVLTYNIEYSGNQHTDAVIEDIGADVVGVLESYDRLPEIAEKAGYPTTTSASSCSRSTPSTSLPVPTACTP